ncbi:hypothetical protein [Streptomyces minutiscleroticus]|uniref:Uncharacterized protein n=1 Tax=Streptomyces minutiscleroticus TaxID=68238 RepID=A0A918KPY2_9ACTN|nr:hypothetical protein [Streptomyces minutiscleroticus]GGX68803.1 hypothetical protein GCM10010358_23930 [Streptomyces minutiscleroticus]
MTGVHGAEDAGRFSAVRTLAGTVTALSPQGGLTVRTVAVLRRAVIADPTGLLARVVALPSPSTCNRLRRGPPGRRPDRTAWSRAGTAEGADGGTAASRQVADQPSPRAGPRCEQVLGEASALDGPLTIFR